jgi:DNA-binding NarL/FixJ family response regulator
MRILLIDSQPVVTAGITAILGPVLETAEFVAPGNLTDAIVHIAAHPVDLIISDFRIEGVTVLSLLEKMENGSFPTRCLIFSTLDEIHFGVPCIRAGASGFLSKSAPPAALLDAIRSILAGRHFLSEQLSKALLNGSAATSSPVSQLSARELQVFSLIGASRTVSQMADHLGLSVKTIEAHREHIKNKLALQNSAQVTAAAIRWYDDTSVAI